MLELGKVSGGFLLGYFVKWGLGRMSSRAADVRQSLRLLSSMSRNAEAVARTIMNGVPDHGMSACVIADRTTLMNGLRRALGGRTNFARLEAAFTAYALSLRCADPLFGPIGEADVAEMRAAEERLDHSIRRLAAEMLSWRLYQHERD